MTPNELPKVVADAKLLLDRIASTSPPNVLVQQLQQLGEARDILQRLSTLTAQGGEAVATLPVEIRGKVYDVPIPVQLHIVMLREKVAGRWPGMFESETALAEWLESMCECNDDGAIGSQKWEPAQRAAAAIRNTTPPAPSSSAVDVEWALSVLDREIAATGAQSFDQTASDLMKLRGQIKALASTAASGGDELPDVACADGTIIPGWIVANMERIAAWFKEHGSESWHVCGIGPIAEPPGGYMLVRKAVVNFLDGSGPLNGYWFDQTVPGKPYWWRRTAESWPAVGRAGLRQRTTTSALQHGSRLTKSR